MSYSGKKFSMEPYEHITLGQVNGWSTLAVPKYGITKRAAEYFGIRSMLSEKDGKSIVKTGFPYYDQQGNVCGYKLRNWEKSRDHKGHITAVGDVNIGCKMFGQQQIENQSPHRKQIVLVEGEGDVAAAWEAAMQVLDKNPKWKGSIVPCIVGLQLGTSNSVAGLSANELFVKSFDKVVMGFDQDKATPAELKKGVVKGEECKENVAAYLLTDLYEIRYAEGCKDARAMYMQDKATELGKLVSFGAIKYTPEKVVSMTDLSFEDLTRKRPEGFLTKSLPKLDSLLHGVRKRELVLLTAPSGAGKSTVMAEITNSLMEYHNQKCGMIFLEEELQETALRIIGRRVKINYNKFKFNPLSHVAEETFRQAKAWSDDKVSFIDHFGSLTCEVLLNKIKHLEHVERCDFIMLDHLSMIFSGSQEKDERRLIDNVMTELAAYVATSDVGIVAVSHMKRKQVPPFPVVDGEKQPVWIEVTKEDMRGSGALEQLSWVVIAVEPEIMPDRSRGRVRLVVLKNRPWSLLGVADVLRQDYDTGLLVDASDDDEPFTTDQINESAPNGEDF